MALGRSRRRRRIAGLIPAIGRALWAGARGAAAHPRWLLLCAALLVGGWWGWGYAQGADVFRIAQVALPRDASFTLRAPILNANLWTLDIHAIADELKRQQPWWKDIRVIREPPNALRVEAIPRIPVAQVRLERWHPVDAEGFLLPSGGDGPDDRLVTLTGLERGGGALKPGAAGANERLQLALRVLKRLRRAPLAVSGHLTDINVMDPQGIRFILDGGLEVRCGSESELDAHLARLVAALKAMRGHALDARYLDVRFQEPVVGPR